MLQKDKSVHMSGSRGSNLEKSRNTLHSWNTKCGSLKANGGLCWQVANLCQQNVELDLVELSGEIFGGTEDSEPVISCSAEWMATVVSVYGPM